MDSNSPIFELLSVNAYEQLIFKCTSGNLRIFYEFIATKPDVFQSVWLLYHIDHCSGTCALGSVQLLTQD